MTRPSWWSVSAAVLMGLMAVIGGAHVASAQAPLSPPTLEAAFARERAELLAEKGALQSQLDALQKDNADREGRARSEVDSLSLAVAAARNDADELEKSLTGLQEEETVTVDRGDVIDATIEIASMGLRKLDRRADLAGDQRAVLERLLASGVQAARELGTVHVRKGAFFDLSGVEHEGTLIHVGRVAALGVDGDAGGTLMLAPGGGFVVVDPGALELARQLVSGAQLSTVPVHLFDPVAGPHEHRVVRTWIDVANAGGPIAWIIVGLGGLVLMIVAERSLILVLASPRGSNLLQTIEASLSSAGSSMGELLSNRRGALARVLRAVVARRGAEREELENVAAEAIYREMPRLERLLPFLSVIAGAAPMLGLLGTVTGMITTFDVITEHGTGDPKMLSGGISEALITTEFGLIVAIPALLLHNLLLRWSTRTLDELQTSALALINLLEKHDGRE